MGNLTIFHEYPLKRFVIPLQFINEAKLLVINDLEAKP